MTTHPPTAPLTAEVETAINDYGIAVRRHECLLARQLAGPRVDELRLEESMARDRLADVITRAIAEATARERAAIVADLEALAASRATKHPRDSIDDIRAACIADMAERVRRGGRGDGEVAG